MLSGTFLVTTKVLLVVLVHAIWDLSCDNEGLVDGASACYLGIFYVLNFTHRWWELWNKTTRSILSNL